MKITKKLAESRSNIFLLDTYSIVCPEEICHFRVNGKDLYRDGDHLSYSEAERMLSKEIAEIIEENAIKTTN